MRLVVSWCADGLFDMDGWAIFRIHPCPMWRLFEVKIYLSNLLTSLTQTSRKETSDMWVVTGTDRAEG
jgi:hypothetical protein